MKNDLPHTSGFPKEESEADYTLPANVQTEVAKELRQSQTNLRAEICKFAKSRLATVESSF